MHSAHTNVDEGAHVVASEAADEVVEFRGGGTYAKEEGHFNEEDDECADSNRRSQHHDHPVDVEIDMADLQTHYTERNTANRRKDVGDT